MDGSYICQNCGRTCNPKTITKGSIAIEIILWLMLLLPGLIYSVWRHTSRYKGCSYCGSESLVPATSPHGRVILDLQREKTEIRACPHCGEEIKRVARLCKHCRSTVEPLYVDNIEANRQIVLIGQLVSKSMLPEQIVEELNRQQVPCLLAGARWNPTLVKQLISDFSLAKM
jgi:hypothetical protein